MSKPGMLTRVFGKVRQVVTGRELVGADSFGNKFYTKKDKDENGQEIVRRLMEAPGGSDHKLYDPDAINTLWRQWLSRTRANPPTDDELLREDQRRTDMRARVMQVNAERERRDRQAAAEGRSAERAGDAPNMDRFIGQLSGKGYAADSKEDSHASQQQQSQKPQKESKGSDFKPDTWQPGA